MLSEGAPNYVILTSKTELQLPKYEKKISEVLFRNQRSFHQSVFYSVQYFTDIAIPVAAA